MPATRGITPKQKKFVESYIETGNGKQAALKAYNTTDDNVACVIASENLTKPKIIEYLESKSEVVASHIFDLALSAESEQVQLGASKDILDRAGFKPVEKTENKNVNLNFDVKMTPEQIKLKEKFEEDLFNSL